MGAEANVIKKADMGKVRELDFTQLFGENIKGFVKMLGVARMIPVTAGTVLKKLTVTGTLQTDSVAEGDVIPLSNYKTAYTPIGEAKLEKFRKGTTAEAILQGGYDQAVNSTNKKMLLDIQKKIRGELIASFADGTVTASGNGLQAALADAWGKLQIAFEDETVQTVYFINPLDIADYLKTAQVSLQTAFGMSYIENFLGLGTVITSSQIEQGTFYATAAQNIVAYYVNANEANGLGEAFEFTIDPDTGFIGVHEVANYERMQSETIAITGVDFFAEMPAGVIVGSINSNF